MLNLDTLTPEQLKAASPAELQALMSDPQFAEQVRSRDWRWFTTFIHHLPPQAADKAWDAIYATPVFNDIQRVLAIRDHLQQREPEVALPAFCDTVIEESK